MKRVSRTIVALLAVVCSTSVSAQKPKEDPFDEAHRAILGAKENPSSEAVRRSNELSTALPGGSPSAGSLPRKNFIDEHIFGRIERDRIPQAGLTGDEEFIRRAFLDATGEVPTGKEVRDFLANPDPGKRDKLIDSLVGTEQFAEVWAWLYGDLFRLDGDAGGGRISFHEFNKEWLRVDRPYNEVVYDLLTVSTKSHSAIPAAGLLGRNNIGLNNLPRSAEDLRLSNRLDVIDELGTDIARLFLGINTTCISCHDGAGHLESLNLYLSQRTRDDFYRHSAFFGNYRALTAWSDRSKNTGNGDQVIDDLGPGYNTASDSPFVTASIAKYPRDGKNHEPAFLLTGETPRPGANRRAELVRMLTSHIQFSRATVNMIWARLMVVPFVEPFDGFDLARLDPKNPPPKPWSLQPTNADLLNALAEDFQKNNYSMQHLIRTIMKSNAYQLSARYPAEWKPDYVPYYARKYIRVLTGPEVFDAIAKVTNRPGQFDLAGVRFKRVKELAMPGDVGGRNGGEGKEISTLLQAFFQGNRSAQVPDGNKASTLQALFMTKSKVVNDRVLGEKGSLVEHLLESAKNNDELIDELYLSSLARRPTPAEKEVMLQALESDRKKGAENVMWALLNSVEFLLNH